MGRAKNRNPNMVNPILEHDNQVRNGSIENSKYVYELVNSWIENADNKVSVSCGVFTGIFGVVTFLTEHYLRIPDNHLLINGCWQYIYKICFVLSLLAMAVAVYFYARAIIPNLRSSGNQDKKKYPVFYGDIRSLSLEDYQMLMSNGTDIEFNDELIREIWHNSGICLMKMRRYRIGTILSIIAIILAFIALGAHILMYR